MMNSPGRPAALARSRIRANAARTASVPMSLRSCEGVKMITTGLPSNFR